jgi:acyl dehydratase
VFSDRDLEEYLVLSGDRNRLFEDDDHARQNGFLRRIVPGALLGSMISDLLGTHLPGGGTNWLKQQFIFHQPVYLEEVVHASVEIIRLRPGKQLVDLWNSISTLQAGIAVSGRSLVLVKDLVTEQGN